MKLPQRDINKLPRTKSP